MGRAYGVRAPEPIVRVLATACRIHCRVLITEKVSQRTFAQAVVGQDYVVKYLNLEEDGPRYTILTNSPWQIEIPQRLRDYLSTPHDEN